MFRKEHAASSLMNDQKRSLCFSHMTDGVLRIGAVRYLERPLSSMYVCPSDHWSWPMAALDPEPKSTTDGYPVVQLNDGAIGIPGV